jgi:hypothetical protein
MRDGKNVAERVIVETGHCIEIGGERLTFALLKLFDQMLDVLGDDLLRGGLLTVAALRRITAVRRCVVAAVAVAVVYS